jgi:phosphoenolpyruvate-protein kinase (PTS system EI component)
MKAYGVKRYSIGTMIELPGCMVADEIAEEAEFFFWRQ